MLLRTAHTSQTEMFQNSGKIGFGEIVTRGLDDEDRLRRFVIRPHTLVFDPQIIREAARKRHFKTVSKCVTRLAQIAYQ